MDIKEYIAERTFTTSIMAKQLGISVVYLRSIMAKRQRASNHLALHIENYTKGKVKANDILNWELKKSSRSL